MFFEFIITLFIVYICIHALVDRVCRCIEKYKLYKCLDKYLEEEYSTYEKEKEKICERLAEKKEDGSSVIVEEGGKSTYKLTDESLEILNRELMELMNTEIDIPIQTVDSSVFEQCDSSERYHTLSAREMLCLAFMIKEGDE